ncbi:MAG: replication-associated recombination protein A [Calditrichaeota bacterium]|nr:replication-associated recombination protein A [Calditrichota bacterium]
MDLFDQQFEGQEGPDRLSPLAERMRPNRLEDYVGQDHVIGPGTPLHHALKHKRLPSMIFWGPPGVGKTTLARLLAGHVEGNFVSMSAVTAGVADVRKTIEKAAGDRKYYSKATILFIDEIHRFNKSQQDALLHAVEDGTITLIGATTENPSFEVISPLLSRSQVYQLKPLADDQIQRIVSHAISEDPILSVSEIQIEDWGPLFVLAGGDARRALNTIEKASMLLADTPGGNTITPAVLERAAQQKVLYYDKCGEFHYDLISAFIKSVRGSDPDAAVYWMARMLAGGEDPKFIARRMIILASEDIGNADPQALTLATSCFSAVTYIGMPEAQIVLGQAAVYLASAPKSNAAYMAIREAMHTVRSGADVQVPLHLRNAPTGLMKDLDYGKDYRYPHNYPEHFITEKYLPDNLQGRIYYAPTDSGEERRIREHLKRLWANHKDYDNEQSKTSGKNDVDHQG